MKLKGEKDMQPTPSGWINTELEFQSGKMKPPFSIHILPIPIIIRNCSDCIGGSSGLKE